jgi:hypothetical protein
MPLRVVDRKFDRFDTLYIWRFLLVAEEGYTEIREVET